MVLDTDRMWREFNRYTGDGLPDEPVNAPLPIGDPQSGVHNPKKVEARDYFGQIDTAVDETAAAQAAAVAAAALAQSYASAAVAQGNVPIYPTAASIAGLVIPVGINQFRTNGFATENDGGAAIYQSNGTTATANGLQDNTTPTKRQFKLVSDVTALKQFNDDAAAMAVYQAAQLAAARKVYAPIYHPSRGLKISEFLTNSGPFINQATQIQTAIDAMLQNSAYYSLDLEGRLVTVDNTLLVDAALSGSFHLPVTIRNGMIASSTTNWGSDRSKPIMKLYHSGSGTVSRVELENVHFKCGDLASGLLISNSYSSIRVRRCEFHTPQLFAVKTNVATTLAGGDLRLEYNNVNAPSIPLMPDRDLIAFDLGSENDAKIIGNRVYHARTALRGDISSFLMLGNHFWQGPADGTPTPFANYNPVIQLGIRPNGIIAGNYIDNGYVEFREGLVSAATGAGGLSEFQGYCIMTNNIHTFLTAAENVSFIEFRPTTSGCELTNFIITNSQFRNLGDEAEWIEKPFRVTFTGGGGFLLATCHSSKIADNYFRPRATPQSTHIELNIPLVAGQTSYPIDFTGKTPFGLQALLASYAITSSQSPGNVWYDRINGYTGNFRLEVGVPGFAKLKFDCNTDSQFD